MNRYGSLPSAGTGPRKRARSPEVSLTITTFHELVTGALEELDANSEPTEIRRVDAWLAKLTKEVNHAKGDFSESLGERDPDAEDISYSDVEEGDDSE